MKQANNRPDHTCLGLHLYYPKLKWRVSNLKKNCGNDENTEIKYGNAHGDIDHADHQHDQESNKDDNSDSDQETGEDGNDEHSVFFFKSNQNRKI